MVCARSAARVCQCSRFSLQRAKLKPKEQIEALAFSEIAAHATKRVSGGFENDWTWLYDFGGALKLVGLSSELTATAL